MRVLILTIVIVISDQLSKIVVKGFSIPALGISVEGMHYGVSRPILGDFLRLTYIENPGMAFGIDIGGKLFFGQHARIAQLGSLVSVPVGHKSIDRAAWLFGRQTLPR